MRDTCMHLVKSADPSGSSRLHYLKSNDHVLAPLLHHQPTFTAINSIICDKATFQVALLPCCKISIRCHVTVCQQPLPCHLSEAKQSFPPYKEEEILLHPHKNSQASHNTGKHYRLFLCLSHSDKKIPRPSISKHFPGTL